MLQSLLSILLLAAGFGLLFAAGLPVACSLSLGGKAPTANEVWALAPFAGFAIIGTILKTTTRLGAPVKYTAWPMLALIIAGLVLWLVKRRRAGLKVPLPDRRAVLLFAAVVLVAGIGYVIAGAKYFNGYGWWDTLNYGPRVDAIRDFSVFDIPSLNDKMPYLSYFHFKCGLHRASTGVIQAMLSAITFTDGVCTMGFFGAMGPVLTFCALIYLTEGLERKGRLMQWGCLFGALLPGVILTQMECFWGVGSGMPLVLVLCGLLPRMFAGRRWQDFLAVGLLASCIFTTLADATAVLWGLLALCCLWQAFSRKPAWGIFARNAGIFAAAYLIPDLLYLQNPSDLLPFSTLEATTQTVLTSIYPFAYKGTCSLNWLFFGAALDGSGGRAALVIRALAVALFAAGVIGLFYSLIRAPRAQKLCQCALVCLPFSLVCFSADYSYPFFKLLTMASPLLPVGAMLLLYELFDRVDEGFMAHAARPAIWKKLLRGLMCLCLVGALSASAAVSVMRSVAFIPEFPEKLKSGARDYYLRENRTPALIEIYEKLDGTKDENYVLVTDFPTTTFWWLCYYGRDNNLYTLFKENDDVYAFDMEFSYAQPENIPADATVVFAPGTEKYNIAQNAAENTAVMTMAYGETQDYWLWRLHSGDPIIAHSVDFRAFSPAQQTGLLQISVTGASALNYGGVDYPVENGTASIPITLPAGGSSHTVTASDGAPFDLGDCAFIAD